VQYLKMANNGEFTLEQLENMLAGTGGDMFDAQWQVQQRYNQQLAQQQLQNQLLEQRQAMLSRQHYLLQVCIPDTANVALSGLVSWGMFPLCTPQHQLPHYYSSSVFSLKNS
jgi:hypothetical protein